MALPAHRAGERLPLTSEPLTLRPATLRSATLRSASPVSSVEPLRQAAPSDRSVGSATGVAPRARPTRSRRPGQGPTADGTWRAAERPTARGRARAAGASHPRATAAPGAMCRRATRPPRPGDRPIAPSTRRPVDLPTHRLIDSSTTGSSAGQPAPWPADRPVARSTGQTLGQSATRPLGHSATQTVGPRLRAAAQERGLQPPTPAAVSFDCRLSAAAAAPTRPASVPITAGATVSRRTKDSVA